MENAELFLMQYAMRRAEIEQIADIFAEALEEDLRENADMFDRNSTAITGKLHPNATMRRLEDRLAKTDLPLLQMLSVLILLGTDIVLGLAQFDRQQDFLLACAEEQALLERRDPDAVHLARALTEVKAEHQQKRLRAAMAMLSFGAY